MIKIGWPVLQPVRPSSVEHVHHATAAWGDRPAQAYLWQAPVILLVA
jgi:hypothetical protein